MFEYLCIMGSIAGFASLHTFYRIASRRINRPQAVNVVFLACASGMAGLAAALVQHTGYRLPAASEARFLGLAMGTGSLVPIAVIFYMLAVRCGKLAPSAMILCLSVSVPILGSIFFYHERVTPIRAIAILLALVAVVLVCLDRMAEERKKADVG